MSRITARCQYCGSDPMRIPDEADADQTIYCISCNAVIGDRAEVGKQIVEKARQAADQEASNMLKRTLCKRRYIELE